MRSSVSVILSNPPPDTTMSYPDYSAHPHHHHALLVLVRQVGSQLKNRYFHKLYERISRITHVKVSDSSGNVRPVWITYKREYPVENNDWGDFQAHRRVLGIISIGQVGCQTDLNDVCLQHESLKVKYSSTLYDSRCIILGLNPDGTVYQRDPQTSVSSCSTPELSQNGNSSPSQSIPVNGMNGDVSASSPPYIEKTHLPSVDRDSGVYVSPPVGSDLRHQNGDIHGSRGSDSGSESTCELGGEDPDKTDSPVDTPLPFTDPSSTSSKSSGQTTKVSLQPPTSFKTRALFYPTAEHAVNIESQIHEFISSLFWVLEYKRMEKTQEKFDRPQLLCAPFERKDLIGIDLDSRTNRKKCTGRLKKHLADLSLQVGLPTDALAQYSQAVDILRGCNDWLWLAACYEGLCSTSVMLLYPHLFRNNVLQRYSSLGVGGSDSCPGTKINPNKVRNNPSSNSNSLPVGLDPSLPKQTSKFCLSPDDIVEKYKEAIVHYSKYRNAGVIETEASIKAVHVLIEQKRYLLAAEFLSNVVFINLQLSDEEKIIRFNALSDMYNQIGFHRKAAFFRRVAAMRCVAPQNQDPDWCQCYKLLLLTLDGYRLSLDPVLFLKEGRPGWPALQIQILQELVGTSRRMGEHGLCTRHQAFLLSAMLPYFTLQEKHDNFKMLESVSSKCGSGPSPLVVADSSFIIPPVNFPNIPLCRYVRVMPPSKERQVELRDKLLVEDPGPFIFSPFQSIITTSKVAGKIDCEWVEGDICEVTFAFVNPMYIQLKLNNMMLITEGVEFEAWTSTVVIEASPEAQMVILRGRPQEPGELRILGYSFSLLGVASNCKFKSMSHLKVPFYSLNVVPALPCVQIFCDSSSSETGLVSDGALEGESKVCVTLNAGETHECNIVIHNVSSQSVESVEVALESQNEVEGPDKIFQYSLENLRAQLPIAPGGRASLTLYIYAASEFLLPGYSIEDDGMFSLMSGSEPPSLLSAAPSSLHSRQSTIMSSLRGRKANRAHSSASNASSKSGSSVRSGSSVSALAMSSINASTPMPTTGLCNRTLEGLIKLSYTGGRGMENKYWRMADIGISVEVAPSLLVTRWDALPAERPNQCYIVLDLLNSASNEMDLQYTTNKHILMQGGESCRVPVPVDRCPLAKINERRNTDGEVSESEILGDHVASLVELRWTLGPFDTPGRASLKSLTFPPQTHHLITMAPVHWDVSLNGQRVENGSENVGKIGEAQRLVIGVSNSSGDSLPPLTIVLTAFQDHQNGTQNYRLEAKMASTGATKFGVPKLAPEESYSHDCGLIFFTTGIYKIEVSGSPSSSSSTPYGNYQCSSVGVPGDHHSKTNQHYHAWKLAPPIEISIVD
ncbi:UNVERIFIED_CONTAM: hypothetical protein RMT77_002654 [Armadillidium vulgare]